MTVCADFQPRLSECIANLLTIFPGLNLPKRIMERSGSSSPGAPHSADWYFAYEGSSAGLELNCTTNQPLLRKKHLIYGLLLALRVEFCYSKIVILSICSHMPFDRPLQNRRRISFCNRRSISAGCRRHIHFFGQQNNGTLNLIPMPKDFTTPARSSFSCSQNSNAS